MEAYEDRGAYRIRDRVLRRASGLDPDAMLTPDQLKTQLSSFYSAQRGSERFWREMLGMSSGAVGPLPGTGAKIMGGLSELAGQGIWHGAAGVLPIEPPVPKFMTGGSTKGVLGSVSPGMAKMGKAAFRWAGPALVGYRAYDEGITSLPRIVTEEAASAAGWGIGSTIGGAIGTAIAPGVGTTIGYFAGGFAGALIGQGVGSTISDVAGAPFRAVPAAYKFFRNTGMQNRRLELGGNMSAGNRSMYAQTMRQRALMQMNRSGQNARSLLGREAQFMHVR